MMQETKETQNTSQPPAVPHKQSPSYFTVFIALAVLTAIEIVITQLPLPKAPILIPLAIIKATLVALFYMHLRSDRKLFSAVFIIGIVVGLSLIISFAVLFNAQTGGY